MTGAWISFLFAATIAHFIIANLVALLLLGSAAVSARRRWQRTLRTEAPDPAASPLTIPLSAIIPAFNEQEVVVDSVLAILQTGLPEFEIIVVDDGSTDETISRMTAAFDMAAIQPDRPDQIQASPIEELLQSRKYPNVYLIRKRNAGKADAVNAGVNLARYRFVLLTDADSIFEPGALLTAMTAIGFDAGAHIGVGGMVRVRNGMKVQNGRLVERRLPGTMLGRFQVIEYIGAMTGNRAGWNFLNAVPVLSGAFTIWRRDVLVELGGMTSDTTHEDIEFTLRTHEHYRRNRIPYLITSLPDAIVWTEAPHRWRDFYKQRKRWQRVVFECLWRYRRMIGNPRYGEVGTVTMPYMLVFEGLGPFFELGALVLITVLYFLGMLSPVDFGLFMLFSASLVALTRIVAITLEASLYHRFPPGALTRLSGMALLEMFLYRPVILAARLMAFPEFLSGRKTWERALRQPGMPAP